MRTNKVVTRMNAGEVAYGCQMVFPSPDVVELMGRAGLDYVLFDGEHGAFEPATLDDLCRIADMAGLTPTARVPNIDDWTILRFLDRGIMGITGPHITNGERAQQLAQACRYVPRGRRSFGTGRGGYYGDVDSFPQYLEHTNDNILVVAQLEDVDSLTNIGDILSVEGIDLYQSGAHDIAQSMGLPGQPDHPRVKEFEAQIEEAVHAAGKKMVTEAMVAVQATSLILDGARDFLKSHGR